MVLSTGMLRSYDGSGGGSGVLNRVTMPSGTGGMNVWTFLRCSFTRFMAFYFRILDCDLFRRYCVKIRTGIGSSDRIGLVQGEHSESCMVDQERRSDST
ncbi:hypothetical protein P691DRAFT_229635 [Macrolepiota fuliginosa MF-IS2]|uniref:Uncharacterized protein n=1 Tax=Macrolepiota fuliginosa MF-IS2 TaxID=1400762 RepID=A0A9P5WWA0_9AGAR|nr:hypothetical protein P691DRAFT_229635 [Macrolepiota fuliginosa MF-IS2]